MAGPLAGMKIVEMAGVGPGPMAAMLLADLGAQVLRIDRTTPSGLGTPRPPKSNVLLRGRDIVALDLKTGAIRWSHQVTEDDNFITGCAPKAMRTPISRCRSSVSSALACSAENCFGARWRRCSSGWGRRPPRRTPTSSPAVPGTG